MLASDFIRKRNTIINSVLNGGALDKAYFAYASLCTQANMPPKSLESFEEMCDDVHHMSCMEVDD